MNNVLIGLAKVLDYLFWTYRYLILASVIISWVQADPSNPIVHFVRSLTDPVFGWFRRRMPFLVVNGIDLSPLVVWLVLLFLEQALIVNLYTWAGR